MAERRVGERFVISYPVRVTWRNEDGERVTQDGLTENIGPFGALIYLPRILPDVGGKVTLTITEKPEDEITVTAQVIRLERNASHPQAALQLLDNLREWKKKVWEMAAAEVAAQEPDNSDDW